MSESDCAQVFWSESQTGNKAIRIVTQRLISLLTWQEEGEGKGKGNLEWGWKSFPSHKKSLLVLSTILILSLQVHPLLYFLKDKVCLGCVVIWYLLHKNYYLNNTRFTLEKSKIILKITCILINITFGHFTWVKVLILRIILCFIFMLIHIKKNNIVLWLCLIEYPFVEIPQFIQPLDYCLTFFF